MLPAAVGGEFFGWISFFKLSYTFKLAPLAGYTDLPFRMACREQGVYYAYTALIDSGALVHGNRENDFILKRGPEEPWLGVQLLGSIPDDIRKSAQMLNSMDFDAVDFNMGCPMAKVVKRPAGAALVRPCNEKLALTCVKILRDIIDKPLTVKLRIRDYNDPEPTVDLCRKLESCGIDGLTLHGRNARAIYAGPVALRVIEAVRRALHIPVTANGGIFNFQDALEMVAGTGCTNLMVARGAIGNPWIFRALREWRHFAPTHEALCDVMERHVLGMVDLYGEHEGFVQARKILVSYLGGRGYRKTWRVAGSQMDNLANFAIFMRDLRAEGPVSESNQLDYLFR